MKRVKRILTMMLAVVLIMETQSVSVMADEETSTAEAETYMSEEADMIETQAVGDVVESGSCGENLTYELTEDGTLTISGLGAMDDYMYFRSDTDSPFAKKDAIKKVIIKEGVTSIGNGTFEKCGELTEIHIPNSVKSIGINAFAECPGLKEIEIPKGVELIKQGAFCYCRYLTNVTIPNTVTCIRSNAFWFCTRLQEVKISASVTAINSGAFAQCTQLSTIYFKGDAPAFNAIDEEDRADLTDSEMIFPSFFQVTAKVYYPIEKSTWTEDVRADCGTSGTLTWIPWDRAAELAIVLESTDKEYLIGSGSNAVIKCTGELDDFVSVAVDGQLLDSSCYTAMVEPTVLTLLSAYLDTLSVGNHTVTLNYTYGSIDSMLTVNEKNETVNDNENMGNVENVSNTELAIVMEVTDREYFIGSGGDATIKCTGELKDFVSVFMDGQLVDISCYIASEGSTVLTFLSSYLDKLSVGDHVVTLNYTYGSIDTTLTVLDRNTNAQDSNMTENGNGTNVIGNAGNTGNIGNTSATPKVSQSASTQGGAPKTGDNTLMTSWLLVMMMAGGGCVLLAWTKKRRFAR